MNFDIHTKWMEEAYNLAIKSYNCDEVPVGAIIVENNKIIGRGHNEVEKLNDSTAHAEMIAITSAANYKNDWRLIDTSIYITKEPCIMCYGAILNSRIKIQKKIHPDISPETSRLSSIVNEAKDIVLNEIS